MLQRLPSGIQTFEKLRTEDYLYVDKVLLYCGCDENMVFLRLCQLEQNHVFIQSSV